MALKINLVRQDELWIHACKWLQSEQPYKEKGPKLSTKWWWGVSNLLKGEIAPWKCEHYSKAETIEDVVPHFNSTW